MIEFRKRTLWGENCVENRLQNERQAQCPRLVGDKVVTVGTERTDRSGPPAAASGEEDWPAGIGLCLWEALWLALCCGLGKVQEMLSQEPHPRSTTAASTTAHLEATQELVVGEGAVPTVWFPQGEAQVPGA